MPADAVAGSGGALALTEQSLRFRAPLRSRDRVCVTVRVARCTAARVTMEQQVIRLPSSASEVPQVVLTATAVVVSLDGQYRPQRIHPSLRERLMSARPPPA